MPSRPLPTFLVVGALLAGPTATAQPIEPLGHVRPAAPEAPADVAAPPADATKTESGLAFKVLAKAKGTTHPGPRDKVTINFTAWTPEGELIASSIPDGEPWTLVLDGALKGLSEGLLLMSKGEKRRLWIPAELASTGRPKRRGPPGPAVFDVELLSVHAMPKTPEDVAAVPKTATRTRSGLAYRVIKQRGGGDKPNATDTVEVHYSGWTLDGKMFDSSHKRGQTTKFPLNGVIKGWTEGVQLMSVGDTYRFWIPADLAYGETPSRPGAPAGMLVFDIELVSIQK
jgi:peptidylprolyl isomerase